MKRFISLLLALTMLTIGGQGDATQLLTFIGGDEGGGVQAFLPNLQGNFVVSNFAPHSNDFVPADGFWTTSNNVAAAPTVTTVSDTLPDGTTGNVSKAVFGSTTTGTNQVSVLTHADTNGFASFPLSFSHWAKVVSGTGVLFTSISNSGAIQSAPITNDGNWHEIQAPWTGSSNGGGSQVTLQIGINQNDPAQRTPVSSTTIELAGAFFSGSAYANVPSFADLKTGGDLATTGSTLSNVQVTEPFPANVGVRDPSKWVAFSGNPITKGNPAEVWAGGGRGNPIIQAQFPQQGGFFWAWNAQCYPSPAVNSLSYTAQCLYKSTDALNWTEDTTNAPYLFLTGSNLFNPVINAPGSGFTASASGTATWTGGGCATPPVIAVTTNSSGAIATATPSPNNGIGTGSCPVNGLPTGTSWSFSGVGSGSGATFNWNQTKGTQTAPGPVQWELHPQWLPFGCNDGTNPHNFCVIYSGRDASGTGHLYTAWSDTINGVYTPLGCSGPGTCGTTVPVTINNLPSSSYGSQGVPTVINVGGATGVNYIYVFSGGDGTAGIDYSYLTTPANKALTTSGNTLTFVGDMGFTDVSGKDWYQPTTGTTLLDPYIFLNHCGFYEFYFTLFSGTSPSPPWLAGSPGGIQIVGEAVSNSPNGPWYQYPHPVVMGSTANPHGNSGDPSAIELNGQFIWTSPFNDIPSNTGAGFALTAPQGRCPGSLPPPTETALPGISGTPQVGQTLTASNGSWTGSPTVFTYQWLSGGSPISGATSSTYVPVTGDVGAMLSVKVTANNGAGSTPATSATVGPVTASGGLVACTGGTQTTDGAGNLVATFTSSGTLNCSGSIPAAEILVVGGGAGATAAGAGAGGYCTTEGTPTCSLPSSVAIPTGSTTVTIGSGGTGVAGSGSNATAGTNSSLGSIITALGGAPGENPNNTTSHSGGSGGGAGAHGGVGNAGPGGIGTQGNNGGTAEAQGNTATIFPGAGGGGAGAVGGATFLASPTVAGNGGAGLSNSITGTATFYAGGGGGGFFGTGGATVTAGSGGTGGGGAGSISGNGTSGSPNTGGGGGGGFVSGIGGGGGTGVVVVSCPNTVCSAL